MGAVRGYSAVGLYMPKDALNIGSALRAAGCFNASLVAVSGRRYKPVPTDTQKAYRHIPLLQVDDLKSALPYDAVPVGVDLVDGARPLPSYVHPERAFYIFGPEDGTLGPGVLSWCRDIVCVSTKHCMNLAATVNVVLYDRLAKRGS